MVVTVDNSHTTPKMWRDAFNCFLMTNWLVEVFAEF